MAYREDGYRGPALKIGALVAALVIGKIAWPVVAPYVSQKVQMAELSSETGTEDALLGDSVVGATVRVVKERFPTDYARLLVDMRTAAQRSDQGAARAVLLGAIGRIYGRDRASVYQAPHASLAAIRSGQAAVVDALRYRPAACAAYLGGRPVEATLDPDTERAMTEITRLRLLAIADGRDHPAGRAPLPLPRDTLGAFRSAIEEIGMTAPARELLTGERTAAQATDEAQCEAEGALLQAIGTMPAAQGDAFFAAALVS